MAFHAFRRGSQTAVEPTVFRVRVSVDGTMAARCLTPISGPAATWCRVSCAARDSAWSVSGADWMRRTDSVSSVPRNATRESIRPSRSAGLPGVYVFAASSLRSPPRPRRIVRAMRLCATARDLTRHRINARNRGFPVRARASALSASRDFSRSPVAGGVHAWRGSSDPGATSRLAGSEGSPVAGPWLAAFWYSG